MQQNIIFDRKSYYEPPRDKTNKTVCVPSEDSDQPGHPPSPIRVFAVRVKKPWVLSCPLSAQRRLWSGWADAQADLSLHWAHTHFVGFVTSRLLYEKSCTSLLIPMLVVLFFVICTVSGFSVQLFQHQLLSSYISFYFCIQYKQYTKTNEIYLCSSLNNTLFEWCLF